MTCTPKASRRASLGWKPSVDATDFDTAFVQGALLQADVLAGVGAAVDSWARKIQERALAVLGAFARTAKTVEGCCEESASGAFARTVNTFADLWAAALLGAFACKVIAVGPPLGAGALAVIAGASWITAATLGGVGKLKAGIATTIVGAGALAWDIDRSSTLASSPGRRRDREDSCPPFDCDARAFC